LDVGNAYQHSLKDEEDSQGGQTEWQLKIEAWKAILADSNESPETKQQTRKLLEAELRKNERYQ
jgi:hypothetical protein